MLVNHDGIRFAPHAFVTDTDRDKYCVHRIVDFYQKQPTQIREYLFACWRLRFEGQSIDKLASDYQLSPKYLTTIWEILHSPEPTFGPLAIVRNRWESLPLKLAQIEKVRADCEDVAQWIQSQRTKLVPQVSNLKGPGVSDGSQSLELRKNRQMAANRRRCREEGFADIDDSSHTDEYLTSIREVEKRIDRQRGPV